MTNIQIVNEAIKIVEKIDSDKMIVGNCSGDGCGCVLHHLYKTNQAVCWTIGDIIFDSLNIGIVDVNDGTNKKYKQPTPKERVLAAFNDCLVRMRT